MAGAERGAGDIFFAAGVSKKRHSRHDCQSKRGRVFIVQCCYYKGAPDGGPSSSAIAVRFLRIFIRVLGVLWEIRAARILLGGFGFCSSSPLLFFKETAPTSIRHPTAVIDLQRHAARTATTAVERATARVHSHLRGCRSVGRPPHTTHARVRARLMASTPAARAVSE